MNSDSLLDQRLEESLNELKISENESEIKNSSTDEMNARANGLRNGECAIIWPLVDSVVYSIMGISGGCCNVL
jgi:hypothetical protein